MLSSLAMLYLLKEPLLIVVTLWPISISHLRLKLLVEKVSIKKLRNPDYIDDEYGNIRIDYARETWEALTDGQYGDFPGGYIDYEIMGF